MYDACQCVNAPVLKLAALGQVRRGAIADPYVEIGSAIVRQRDVENAELLSSWAAFLRAFDALLWWTRAAWTRPTAGQVGGYTLPWVAAMILV